MAEKTIEGRGSARRPDKVIETTPAVGDLRGAVGAQLARAVSADESSVQLLGFLAELISKTVDKRTVQAGFPLMALVFTAIPASSGGEAHKDKENLDGGVLITADGGTGGGADGGASGGGGGGFGVSAGVSGGGDWQHYADGGWSINFSTPGIQIHAHGG